MSVALEVADGGSRRYPLLIQLLTIVLLSVPGLTWILTTGDVTAYWRYDVPPGQVIYLLSKLAGLYAFVVFWMQLMYGLLGPRDRARFGVELGNDFHRKLGGLVGVLIVAHVALFVGGVSIRTHHFASQYLTISFSHGYYRSIISLGFIAVLLVAVGFCAALARRALHRHWRLGHRVLLVAFVLAFIHSISIGSESRVSPISVLYAVMGLLALGAVIRRVSSAMR